MKKRSHLILAFLLNFIFIYFTIYLGFNVFSFNLLSILIISLIISFYCLLPDIDHKSSTITWFFFGIAILGLITGIIELYTKNNFIPPLTILVFSTLLLVLTFMSTIFFEHRGFTHSILAGFLAILPLWFLFNNLAYCLIAYVSWHSHLIGDGLFFKIK